MCILAYYTEYIYILPTLQEALHCNSDMGRFRRMVGFRFIYLCIVLETVDQVGFFPMLMIQQSTAPYIVCAIYNKDTCNTYIEMGGVRKC